MIGELSSALPCEGGYYAWVRRGLGNFWGFQEAWLSLAASIFDMAIYPTLFVFYLKQMSPWFAVASHGVLAGVFARHQLRRFKSRRHPRRRHHVALAFLRALRAIRPSSSCSRHSNLGALAEAHAAAPVAGTSLGLLGGVLVAMWNYMGWDNASTIAGEVEKPQRTYPRAMIAAVVLVSLTYVLPFVAVYFTGVPASVLRRRRLLATIAATVGGKILGFEWLRFAIVLGGMMSAFGMFNALVMSYSRLPLAMAQDGILPEIFRQDQPKSPAPHWVSIIFLASCWALCLGLGFQRLITLDIMLYGGSLSLEFITLIVLRIREPHLKREFKVPGGLAGAATLGIFPLALLALAMVESEHESHPRHERPPLRRHHHRHRHPRLRRHQKIPPSREPSRPSPQPQPNNPPPATNPQLSPLFPLGCIW